MALTVNQKNQILEEEIRSKEEENYRQEIRKKIDKGKWYEPKGCGAKGCLWIIILCIFFIILSAVINSVVNPNSNYSSNSQSTVSQSTRIDENTTYKSEAKDGKTIYSIAFDNPISIDDFAMGTEIKKIITYIYGEGQIEFPINLKSVGTANLLSIDSTDGRKFLMNVFKGNQSGNIVGIGLWKE